MKRTISLIPVIFRILFRVSVLYFVFTKYTINSFIPWTILGIIILDLVLFYKGQYSYKIDKYFTYKLIQPLFFVITLVIVLLKYGDIMNMSLDLEVIIFLCLTIIFDKTIADLRVIGKKITSVFIFVASSLSYATIFVGYTYIILYLFANTYYNWYVKDIGEFPLILLIVNVVLIGIVYKLRINSTSRWHFRFSDIFRLALCYLVTSDYIELYNSGINYPRSYVGWLVVIMIIVDIIYLSGD